MGWIDPMVISNAFPTGVITVTPSFGIWLLFVAAISAAGLAIAVARQQPSRTTARRRRGGTVRALFETTPAVRHEVGGRI